MVLESGGTQYMEVKESAALLANNGDKGLQDAMKLFPEPSNLLGHLMLTRMVSLYDDIEVVKSYTGNDLLRQRDDIQGIVDRWNNSYDTLGVWSTLRKNQPELYSGLIKIGVKFHIYEEFNEQDRKKIIEGLS